MKDKITVLKQGQPIPEGAVQLHLYPFELVLNPRGGHLTKESLGEKILEALEGAYEEFSDPKYGHNPSRDDLLARLRFNAEEELQKAFTEFLIKING